MVVDSNVLMVSRNRVDLVDYRTNHKAVQRVVCSARIPFAALDFNDRGLP